MVKQSLSIRDKSKSSKNTLKYLPTNGYVLIQPEETQTKTASGLYLPETAQTENPQKGKVLATGEDVILDNGTTKKAPVKIGDTVIYKKWGGNEVKEDGKEYLFIKFEDILAVVK